jgi:hypothetical protein
MALDLEQMLAQALRDILEGGWAKYLELEDGQVRTTWHEEGDQRWLEVWGGPGSADLVGRFKVTVGVHPFELMAKPAEEAPAEPVERFWAEVCEGDMAQGSDGKFYRVMASAEGGGENAGRTMVTLDLGSGPGRTYPFPPDGAVLVIRGPAGQAAETLRAAGLGPQVIKS